MTPPHALLQATPPAPSVEVMTRTVSEYGPGPVAVAVILVLFIVAAFAGIAYMAWYLRQQTKQAQEREQAAEDRSNAVQNKMLAQLDRFTDKILTGNGGGPDAPSIAQLDRRIGGMEAQVRDHGDRLNDLNMKVGQLAALPCRAGGDCGASANGQGAPVPVARLVGGGGA